MFLIILGIFILIAGFIVSKQSSPSSRYASVIRIVGVLVLIAGTLTSMFKVIEAGQVGVKSVFGKVDDDVLYSGLNIINPIAEVTSFDVKTQNYTMSGVHDEGAKSSDDALRVLSADGLEVIIDLSVLFRVKASSAPYILREIGTDY